MYIQEKKDFNVRLDLYLKSKCTCKVKCKCKAIMKEELRSVFMNITYMSVIVQNAEYTYPPGKISYCKYVLAFAARTNGLFLHRFTKCA